MKHTIEIDDQSDAGKGLLSIARELERKSKGVKIIDKREDDMAFVKKILKSRKGGLLTNEEKIEFIQSLKQYSGL